ncbi:hypothetical protein T190_00495 [Sinorhizobium meliloti CCBAU 01290]|nr:hypothetical protein T190_00495 [Sinorhizobium meliloti CCBAU 01290]
MQEEQRILGKAAGNDWRLRTAIAKLRLRVLGDAAWR